MLIIAFALPSESKSLHINVEWFLEKSKTNSHAISTSHIILVQMTHLTCRNLLLCHLYNAFGDLSKHTTLGFMVFVLQDMQDRKKGQRFFQNPSHACFSSTRRADQCDSTTRKKTPMEWGNLLDLRRTSLKAKFLQGEIYGFLQSKETVYLMERIKLSIGALYTWQGQAGHFFEMEHDSFGIRTGSIRKIHMTCCWAARDMLHYVWHLLSYPFISHCNL